MNLDRAAERYRKATERADAERETLYVAIREAHRGGMSLRAIAAQTGLTNPRIHQIVKAGR